MCITCIVVRRQIRKRSWEALSRRWNKIDFTLRAYKMTSPVTTAGKSINFKLNFHLFSALQFIFAFSFVSGRYLLDICAVKIRERNCSFWCLRSSIISLIFGTKRDWTEYIKRRRGNSDGRVRPEMKLIFTNDALMSQDFFSRLIGNSTLCVHLLKSSLSSTCSPVTTSSRVSPKIFQLNKYFNKIIMEKMKKRPRKKSL